MRDADTEADPRPRSEADVDVVGTQAASPHALAEAAAGSLNATEVAEVKPSGWATASARPIPTAAEALDRSDLPRMRVFHIFGIAAAFGGLAISFPLGGDDFARTLFWIGVTQLGVANIGLVWLSSKPERWRPTPVGVLWIFATMGVVPALYYFGPFSAVVMVLMLGAVFIALGRSQWTSISVIGICIGGHLAVAIPIILGWIDDVGVLSSLLADRTQLVVAEFLIVVFLLSGYGLGRWARHTSATALAELAAAMRVIGDQQQVLADVKDDAARRQRVNEGRWTGQVMGSYRLGVVLGRGAMGEVYDAVSSDGRRPAAVKLLNARSDGSSSLVERFHREMQVAVRLDSPHIVKVFELSPPDAPVPFIAMERLHGTDLASRLRNEPRMPSDELVVLLDQVARGLEVARIAGVVHRDLKPHNLFLHEGTWKILDFGVSKLLGSEGTLTGEGIVGTPQYMAPEQASGGQVTHLADVYALGAIAYRCLTGRSPFKGKDLAELVYQVVHTPPVRPGLLARVPTTLDDVLAIAMAKDPRRRFPSALSFAQAFVAARRGRTVTIDPPANAWT